MLIYCDSNILIYWLDLVGPFQLRARNRMLAFQASGDRAGISDLTRLECRVGALKRRMRQFWRASTAFSRGQTLLFCR